MRTAQFKTVFENIVRLMEKDPDTAALTAAEEARIVAMLNQRVREGWHYAMWPELIVAEERAFRDAWSNTTTYSSGNEVYYSVTDKYYRSLQNANTGNAVSAAAWWAEVTDLDCYLPYEPADNYPVGEVMAITKEAPFQYQSRRYSYEFLLHNNGVQVVSDSLPTTVYLTHRLRPNVFTRVAYNAGTTYSNNDIAYLASSGQTIQYRVATTSWHQIDFPAFLQNFVELAVFSDDLMRDGQKEKADYWRTEAYRHLENEYSTQFRQQAQYSTMQM